MSASKCGHRAVNRGEIGLKADLVSQKSPSSEIDASTHAAPGVVQTFPKFYGYEHFRFVPP